MRAAVCYISADDKAKILIREPGCAVITGARAHYKNIIARTSANNLNVLDHNFHRGSLTPIVEFHMSIPASQNAPWHNGLVILSSGTSSSRHQVCGNTAHITLLSRWICMFALLHWLFVSAVIPFWICTYLYVQIIFCYSPFWNFICLFQIFLPSYLSHGISI